MAITTLDGLVAGMQPPVHVNKATGTMEAIGVMHSLFYQPGGAATAPSPGIGGAALTTYAGQVPWTNPSSGNAYLARLATRASVAGTLYLCDRLWHNSGINVTTTTGQTVTSAAWPARDRNGSTNGDGVFVGIEVSTATTNGAAVTNTTLTYTNSANTGSRSATIPSSVAGGGFPATAVAGTFVPFLLAAGDVGVRSIQTVTLGTSYGGGAIHLVAYRLIASVQVTNAGVEFASDAVSLGMPRMYADSVPFLLWLPSATTTGTVQTDLVYSHG